MATLWRRAKVYLGLEDEDEYYEYDYDDYGDEPAEASPREPVRAVDPEPAVRPVRDRRERNERHERHERHEKRPERVERVPARGDEREQPTVRPLRNDDVAVVAGGGSAVTPRPQGIRTVSASARVHIVEPAGFNDAQEVGERLKGNQPVILNLQGLPRDLQRRLIDFSSGLAFALGGAMARVADQVFLLTPTDVEVSQEEKERLQARGLYTG